MQGCNCDVYLLHCFAHNFLVLLLGDFLLLVKRFDGCFHFIYSFLLDLLFLQQKQTCCCCRRSAVKESKQTREVRHLFFFGAVGVSLVVARLRRRGWKRLTWRALGRCSYASFGEKGRFPVAHDAGSHLGERQKALRETDRSQLRIYLR